VEPGQKLRSARERLHLRYRDVEEASQRIANERGNDEFAIGLSRLADIENKGTVPSIFRLYSLCAIYGLDYADVLSWYGVDLQCLAEDAAQLAVAQTRPVDFRCPDHARIDFPVEFDPAIDLRQTTYLTRHIAAWGRVPVLLLNSIEAQRHRYALIGTEDWFMYPLITPGSFVQIDETKRRVARDGWAHEYERPIYLIEHRHGYRCAWCTERDGVLVAVPHSASNLMPEIFRYPGEADIVGQVTGVAMRLDLGKRRHTRSSEGKG
jgi:transcriptional regulator with XRE-family HTH domain